MECNISPLFNPTFEIGELLNTSDIYTPSFLHLYFSIILFVLLVYVAPTSGLLTNIHLLHSNSFFIVL